MAPPPNRAPIRTARTSNVPSPIPRTRTVPSVSAHKFSKRIQPQRRTAPSPQRQLPSSAAIVRSVLGAFGAQTLRGVAGLRPAVAPQRYAVRRRVRSVSGGDRTYASYRRLRRLPVQGGPRSGPSPEGGTPGTKSQHPPPSGGVKERRVASSRREYPGEAGCVATPSRKGGFGNLGSQ